MTPLASLNKCCQHLGEAEWNLLKTQAWDFPGEQVVKTLPSNARGARLIPGQGAKILHALWDLILCHLNNGPHKKKKTQACKKRKQPAHPSLGKYSRGPLQQTARPHQRTRGLDTDKQLSPRGTEERPGPDGGHCTWPFILYWGKCTNAA